MELASTLAALMSRRFHCEVRREGHARHRASLIPGIRAICGQFIA